jgi:hypothetical protein
MTADQQMWLLNSKYVRDVTITSCVSFDDFWFNLFQKISTARLQSCV